jgi:hypothetical protein
MDVAPQPGRDPREDDWLLRAFHTSPSYWSAVIELQLRRIERGAEPLRHHEPHPERLDTFDGFGASMTHGYGIVDADVYFLLVAVRHVLDLSDRYEKRYDADRVRVARAAFDVEAPDAKDMRDVLSHLAEYAVREGRWKQFGADGQATIQVGLDHARGEYDVRAGRLHVEVRRTACAARALARELNAIAVQS